MTNSIDIIFRDNNSMDSLSFYWMAEFNNGVIFQFENGKEHRFQEIKDRFNELEYFHLYHKEKDIRFIIDLKKGLIKTINADTQEIIEEKNNIRLIYFRRNRKIINEFGLEQKHIIWYFLGIQWNDKNGNNRRIVLKIDKEGNWIIGDN